MTLIAAFRRRSPLHTVLLLAAAPLCAIPMNVGRIVLIAIAHEYWQYDLLADTPHAVLGYVLLAAASVLALSADRFIRLLGGMITGQDSAVNLNYGFRNPCSALWNSVWSDFREVTHSAKRSLVPSLLAGCVAVCLCGWQCLTLFAESQKTQSPRPQRLADLELPKTTNGFVRAGRETIERSRASSQGQYSEVWRYELDQMKLSVSCDFPFTGWHDLSVCYTGLGWEVEESLIVSEDDGLGEDGPAIALSLSKPTGERAYLIYGLFDSRGVPVRPGSIGERLLRSRGGETYQVQCFLEGQDATQPAIRAQIQRVHVAVRSILRKHVGGSPSP